MASFGYHYALSIVNETIGVCSSTNEQLTSANCLQFTADGDLKLNFSYVATVLPHTDVFKIRSRFDLIHTLPGEGFVMTSLQFIECRSSFRCNVSAPVGHSMVKLEANREKIVNHYTQHYDDTWVSYTREVRQLWKNEETNAYCALLLRHSQGLDSFNLTATCYNDISLT